MNITILVAGTNHPSNADMLADNFVKGVQQHNDTQAQKQRLNDLHIEHFSLECYDSAREPEEDFKTIQTMVEQADGLVIATPIWNFGVPAHLKNFIDRMGSFALDDTKSRGTLHGLPFYVIFTGGAPAPAWKGLMKKTTSFVPQALQYFGASYYGHHFEGKCTKGRGQFGLVVDQRPDSLAAIEKKGLEFAQAVQVYKDTGQPPFKYRAKAKVMAWGEKLLKKLT